MKVKKCKTCNKIISEYNKTKYCFSHQYENARADDEMEEQRIYRQRVYYANRAKKEKNDDNND